MIGNGAYGVFIIRSSRGNLIYNNTLMDNASLDSYDWDSVHHFEVNCQALDEGNSNVWYKEEAKLGNRWLDYSSDGVYKIDGSANSIDRYPIKIGGSQGGDTKPVDNSTNSGVPGFPSEALALGVTGAFLFPVFRKQN
jgi:hypothetical protein